MKVEANENGVKLPEEVRETFRSIVLGGEPIETVSTATTALKGESKCRLCQARGLFSFSGRREWAHKTNCPWVIAVKYFNVTN